MTRASPRRPRALVPGSRLGRYLVGDRLARGGMAEVYLASSEGVGGFSKPVALKLILPGFADDAEFRRMFLAEAKLVARLDHPNIAQVLDAGEEHDELFIAMEYVHGHTLRSLLEQREGPPPLEVALFVLRETCGALHYAHNARDERGAPMGVVHRDVSPSNLMIRHDGQVKLLDFGIAKASSNTTATRSGVVKGKGGYMSPEQCLGLPVTYQTDVFALGILLYEATTRQRLFRGDNDYDVMNRIIEGRFVRPRKVDPRVPAVLESIILCALERKPEDRFEDAAAVQAALDDAAEELGIRPSGRAVADYMNEVFGPAPSITLPRDMRAEFEAVTGASRPSARRSAPRRTIAWVLGVGVGAVIGGLVVGLVQASYEDRNAQDDATREEVGPPPRVVAPAPARDEPAVPSAGDAVPPVEPEPPSIPETVAPAKASTEPTTAPRSKAKRSSKRERDTSTSRSPPKPTTRRDPLFPWKG